MQNKTLPGVIILLVVSILIVGGGAYWYSQNQDIIAPKLIKNADETVSIAATLAYQQGDVQVQKDGSNWQTVETDTVLHQGDSVKTGNESKAIIELENGDAVRLGYMTEIFITSLTTDDITISQISGASYNRVAKELSRTYQVKVDEITIKALGTAFDVVEDDEKVDVNVVESKVEVITDEGQDEVVEGESAVVQKKGKGVEVKEMDKTVLNNDWYKWNKEEDSKKTDKLGVLSEYAGPALEITGPADGTITNDNKITVYGTVDNEAVKVMVNNEEVEILPLEITNSDISNFYKEVLLKAGKNIISIIAEDSEGNRTLKELKVHYQVAAAATPIKLEAETQTDGVHLSWNVSTNSTLQYYKIVRSETNADLKYPDDKYIAVKNAGEESYTDTDVSEEKTYYYRICEVMTGGEVFCSNVAHMKGKQAVEPEQEQEPETDDSADTVQTTGITLTATAADDGIHLSWTVTDLTITKGFKIAKGESANPVYPGNDYQYLSDSAARSYTWALTSGNTHHFRVCQYNGDGKCLVYSNDVKITAKNVTPQYTGPVISVKAEADGVGIWWTDKSDLPGFKYYKVVRSETNADLKYPDDSYIAAKSKNQNSHRDYSSVSGTSYYYRVCAVGNSVYCSNVVQVTAINTNSAPEAVTLSGSYSEGAVNLSWTQSDEVDFKYYKVVWSINNTTPAYPADGYLTAQSKASIVTYQDDGSVAGSRKTAVTITEGTHYYSVCVVDQANQITCSNVVTMTPTVSN